MWEARERGGRSNSEYVMQYQLDTVTLALQYRRLLTKTHANRKPWIARKSLIARGLSRSKWQARVEARGYRIKSARGACDTMICGSWVRCEDGKVIFSARGGPLIVNNLRWSKGGQLKMPMARGASRQWYPVVRSSLAWFNALRDLCIDTFGIANAS